MDELFIGCRLAFNIRGGGESQSCRLAVVCLCTVDNLLIGHGIKVNGWLLRTVSRHTLR